MKKHLVIIPIYNETKIIKKTLAAYVATTDRKTCVTYLIDDGSNQQTKIFLADFKRKHPWLQLETIPRNIGKPKAVNKIMHQYGSADFYTILDSDVKILTPHWNTILLRAHAVWNNTVLLGGQLDQKGYVFKKGGMTFLDVFPFWTLAGGFFSIPKKAFNQLGYFYDRLRRHEDADYCRRASTKNIHWYITTHINSRLLPHISAGESLEYEPLREREFLLYKKRAKNIMIHHDAYYNPFQKNLSKTK